MADETTNREAFEWQARYCDANDAPLTAALCRSIGQAIARESALGRRILDWPTPPIPDALPLRTVGGFHALWRDGRAPELAPVLVDGDVDAQAVASVIAQHDAELAGWLDGPPQTNEPGRSAALMTGLLEIAKRFGPRVELLEIGSSAGLNLLIDRYRFDLGGVTAGPADSPVTIRPEWRGPPPPAADIAIQSVRGVDIQPIDPTGAEAERRLLAYIWIDHAIRFPRVAAAIQMIRDKPVMLEQGDAADWVEARLAEPQEAGVTRILMHSIVWQYIPADGQARIEAAMAKAGAQATADRPLGWVALEADRSLNRHDLTVRSWPGGGETALIGHAHAHGFWVERLA